MAYNLSVEYSSYLTNFILFVESTLKTDRLIDNTFYKYCQLVKLLNCNSSQKVKGSLGSNVAEPLSTWPS
jgi:hypothetical protein